MDKKTLIGVALLIVVVGFIFFFSGRQQPDGKPIVIGATLSLTGNYAYLGEAARNGLTLAVEEVNQQGGVNGRPLTLVVEDNAGDAKTAVSGVTKLLSVDNADVIISVFTHITAAVKELAREEGVVMLYASTAGDIAEESELFFRDYYDAREHGRGAADLVKRIEAGKVALLSEQSDQCVLYNEELETSLAASGIEVVHREMYPATATDFRTALLKIKQMNPEALVLCSWRHEQHIMKQFDELEMAGIQTVHWVAPFLPAADTPELRAIFSKNGAVSTWYGYSAETPAGKTFAKRYQDRFGTVPVADAAYAYDDVYLLAKALRSSSNKEEVDAQALSKELLASEYVGASGHVTFDADGISSRDVLFIRAENNTWSPY